MHTMYTLQHRLDRTSKTLLTKDIHSTQKSTESEVLLFDRSYIMT